MTDMNNLFKFLSQFGGSSAKENLLKIDSANGDGDGTLIKSEFRKAVQGNWDLIQSQGWNGETSSMKDLVDEWFDSLDFDQSNKKLKDPNGKNTGYTEFGTLSLDELNSADGWVPSDFNWDPKANLVDPLDNIVKSLGEDETKELDLDNEEQKEKGVVFEKHIIPSAFSGVEFIFPDEKDTKGFTYNKETGELSYKTDLENDKNGSEHTYTITVKSGLTGDTKTITFKVKVKKQEPQPPVTPPVTPPNPDPKTPKEKWDEFVKQLDKSNFAAASSSKIPVGQQFSYKPYSEYYNGEAWTFTPTNYNQTYTHSFTFTFTDPATGKTYSHSKTYCVMSVDKPSDGGETSTITTTTTEATTTTTTTTTGTGDTSTVPTTTTTTTTTASDGPITIEVDEGTP